MFWHYVLTGAAVVAALSIIVLVLLVVMDGAGVFDA